jgi:hypothetical protein
VRIDKKPDVVEGANPILSDEESQPAKEARVTTNKVSE